MTPRLPRPRGRRAKPLVISREEAAELLDIDPDYVRKYLSRRGVNEQRGYDPRPVHRLAAARRAALAEVEVPAAPAGSTTDPTPNDLETP